MTKSLLVIEDGVVNVPFVPAPYEVPSIVKVPLTDLAFMVYFVLVFIKSIT